MIYLAQLNLNLTYYNTISISKTITKLKELTTNTTIKLNNILN